MNEANSGNKKYDWIKVFAGISPDEAIKVLNLLKSASDLGMEFEYPWDNDKKKLKFAIKGLQLARYLVTVLGSNIKTVTWMGDNVEYNTLFQGGSKGYITEDTNELDGDYDSANSAITVIEKLGPLSADAPYVIEFKKEPKSNDWANFMISCQGIGDDITISDLYGSATAVGGTTIDNTDSNDYASTQAMAPSSDDRSFAPTTLGAPAYFAAYATGSTVSFHPGANTVLITPGIYNSNFISNVSTTTLEAGYYLAHANITTTSDSAITFEVLWSQSVSAVSEHKVLQTMETTVKDSSPRIRNYDVVCIFHTTAGLSSLSELFRIRGSAPNGVTTAVPSTVMISPITSAQYDALVSEDD